MRRRSSQLIALLLCLTAGLLLLSGVHAQDEGGTGRLTPVDDTLDDFDNGLFSLTQLVNFDPEFVGDEQALQESEEGAIQLALFGSTPEWTLRQGFNLPVPLTNMGAAVVDGRIYVIGGASVADGELELQDAVWSAAVDVDTLSLTYGELLEYQDGESINNWRKESPLPPAIPIASFEGEEPIISAVESPAVTAVNNPNPNGEDYIYVIGGSIGEGTRISSYAVRIGTVPPPEPTALITETGVITWSIGAPVPLGGAADDPPEFGVESASATSVTIGDKTYVYVIGGLQILTPGAVPPERFLASVIYAQVDWDNGGRLVKPSDPTEEGWERLDAVPVDDPQAEGLWNNVAFINEGIGTATFQPAGADEPVTTRHALYVLGGQQDQTEGKVTSQIYRALINPEDGSLYWTNEIDGPLQWNVGRMPNSLHQHAGVVFRGNTYIAGGRESVSGQPVDTVLAGYIDFDLEIANVGTEEAPSFFFSSSDGGDPLRGGPRAGHAAVAVPSEDKTGAVMYVLGGRGPDEGELLASVIFSPIGEGLGAAESPYAPEGIYLSNIERITQAEPVIQSIVWNTNLPDDETPLPDVKLEFRAAPDVNDTGCTNVEWSDWTEIDGNPDDNVAFSKDGENIFQVRSPEEIESAIEEETIVFDRCFQYRATLIRGGESQRGVTPSLLDVSLELYASGSPDLFVETIEPLWRDDVEGNLDDLLVVIRNEYLPEPDKTLEPYISEQDKQNNFFVNLFVLREGQAVFTPTLPLSGTVAVQDAATMEWPAFAQVRKGELEAPPTEPYSYTIRRWYNSRIQNGDQLAPIGVTDLFTETGTYRACVAVDGFVEPDDIANNELGYVDETLDGAEANNFACSDPFLVNVQEGVIIRATDKRAANDGFNNGTFRVSYNGDLEEDVEVELAIVPGDDPATYETDYQLLIGDEAVNVSGSNTFTVTLPAGDNPVDITVQATPGTSAISKTVDVQVQNNDAYIVGQPDQDTVTIVPGSEINLSSNALTFVITRTDTTETVDLAFTLGGSATYGEDYGITGAEVLTDTGAVTGTVGVSGTVTLNAGQSEVIITVQPEDDARGDVELILANGDRDRISLSDGGIIYLPLVRSAAVQ